MSKLRPEIVRLMNLAKGAPDEGSGYAPFGFAARVVAASRLAARRSVRRLQWAFSIASWAAALVIFCCGLVLLRQERVAQPASQIVAAAHFFTEHISP
jgi:hypothetical protein